MDKEQILHESLRRLNAHASSTLLLSNNENLFSLADERMDFTVPDNDAVLIKQAGEQSTIYTALIQPWAPQKEINALINQMKSMPANSLLLADFVNPVMAEKFRRRSISFVDCAGNLSLKNDQFDFYVRRKKRPQLSSRRVRGRAFNSAGLKLIFALFNHPELLTANYRDIAKKVNIALGSVGPVMDDLFNSGYILDEGQRRIVNKKRLFERWVDGYLEKLRPKLILGCYTAKRENWWKEADPEMFSGHWGGDVFIAKSTPFMVPETLSLYFGSAEKHRAFVEHYGLSSDADGEICVFKKFWSPAIFGNSISPMVMYADIVDSINPGSWEVAKTFYGEAVAELLID